MPDLASYYTDAHKQSLFTGTSWYRFFHYFEYIPNINELTVLDFGCGSKGGLLKVKHLFKEVIAYDPYIEEYNLVEPFFTQNFDVFFSSDVIEHIPIKEILHIFKKVESQYIFLIISLHAAHNKFFPTGENIHITLKSFDWWDGCLEGIFGLNYKKTFVLENKDDDCVFIFKRTNKYMISNETSTI